MEFYKTSIDGVIVIKPKIFEDSRGYFFESYNEQEFIKNGIPNKFVQDNQSFSGYGTIRGLHFQKYEHAQAKLVRVINGRVLDVAVDLRPGSKTFGQYVSIELDNINKKMLFIPRGFAHGFSVLSETAEFSYKCDNFYNKESESGIIWNDTVIKVDWKIPRSKVIISEKDAKLQTLNQFVISKQKNFVK